MHNLEFSRRQPLRIWAKQGDSARELEFKLINDSLPINLTGCTVTLNMVKPIKVFANAEIIEPLEGKIKVNLSNDILSQKGIFPADISVFNSSGKVISSANFDLDVDTSQRDEGGILASEAMTLLEEKILELRDVEASYAPELNQVKSQLAETKTKTDILGEKIIYLASYLGFKNLGYEGNITPFLEQAILDIQNGFFKPNTGWRASKVKIEIPAGRWTITKKRVFNFLKTNGFSAIAGIHIKGQGFRSTELIVDVNEDTEDNYLFYNDDAIGYMELSDMLLRGKNGVEGFYYINSTSSGNAATFIFRNVYIDNFKRGFKTDGTIMTSEVAFHDCRIMNTPLGGFGIYYNNPQGVNINLYATHMEGIKGTGIRVNKGGNINIYGGSYIASSTGVLFEIDDPIGSGIGTGNDNFGFYGIRTELHDSSKLLVMNSFARIAFYSCGLAVESGINNNPNSTRIDVNGNIGSIHFYSSSVKYKTNITIDENTWSKQRLRMIFEDCNLPLELSAMIFINSVSNVGGIPHVEAIRCGTMRDVSLFRHISESPNVPSVKKIRTIGGISNTEGLPSVSRTFTLPIGATITKISVYHRFKQGQLGGSDYQYKISNSEKILFTSGTFTNTDDRVDSSPDIIYHVANSSLQTFTIENISPGNKYVQAGYILVEYI